MPCPGSGTDDDPYVVSWLEDDAENPIHWPPPAAPLRMQRSVWSTTAATFSVVFSSSAYAGAILGIMEAGITDNITVAVLGLPLYVLGFALGPLVWGPLSELYGRRLIFILSFVPLMVFSAAAANIMALLWYRFLEGALKTGNH